MNSWRHGSQSHEQWDELAVGFALSALEPEELDRFVGHLVHFCDECSQSVADTDAVGAGIAAALVVPEPGEQLRSTVLSAAFAVRPPVPQTSADVPVDAASDAAGTSAGAGRANSQPTGLDHDQAGPSPAEPSPAEPSPAEPNQPDELARRRAGRRRFNGARSGWLVAAAAAVIAVVMSVATFAAIHSRNDARALAREQADALSAITSGGSSRVIQLRTDGGAAMAAVVAHPDSVSVIPSAMPANAANTSYVLWGLTSSTSTPVALGVFDVTEPSSSPMTVGADSRGYDQFSTFAISNEPGHTAPAAPSQVLAVGQQ